MTGPADLQARLDFVLQFTLEYPARGREECVRAARTLLRLARKHGQIQSAALRRERKFLAVRELRAVERIKAVCEAFTLPVRFSSDPRVHTVSVRFPSGRTNGWYGQHWGVPQ